MIDKDGFRFNVGMILCNPDGKVFWARRVGKNVWQFPQGGILPDETPEQAVIRELHEETGLRADDVQIVGCTSDWLHYRLPKRLIRSETTPLCIGQKQRWFALRLIGSEQRVRLDCTDKPEFDHWKWVNYWDPLREVALFKRKVYERALDELQPLICPSAGRRCVPRSPQSSVARKK